VTFNYTQLPLINIEENYRSYGFEVMTDVEDANSDSTQMYQMRLDMAVASYQKEMETWLSKMSLLQQQENTSGLSQAANYPEKPSLELVLKPVNHTSSPSSSSESISISGFNKGAGGLLIKYILQPLNNVRFQYSKKGSGATTKYAYTCKYMLQVNVVVEHPDKGVVYDETMGTQQTKSLGKFKSTYDFQKWFMNNRDGFYADIEESGRQAAIQSSASVLESTFGYVNKSRKAEIYSVKKYKDYDYTDVVMAYDKTSEGLLLVGNSVDRSDAQDVLDEAREMWHAILEESNLQNKKERINAKISAMIWCNLAEIAVWMAEFNEADNQVSKTKNSGVLKAKSHIKKEVSFYKDQRTRWEANFE
jgi:hypothetical protein